MRRTHTRATVTILVTLVVLALAVPAMAGTVVERPIRENLTGYGTGMIMSPTFPEGDTFGGRCSTPSQWISSSAGTGTISHLGKVTWKTEHCFQFPGTFGDAKLVITAADGDRLYGTYQGVMTGETTFVETMVITGGTGRFVGATGTVEESGWFDPATMYMEITGVGTIVYDASNRAKHR
jgi:hypothetical protein